MSRWMDSKAPAGWVFQWLSSSWRVQINWPIHWNLFTLIQCFSHGYMGRNDSQTKHTKEKKIQTKATTCWARRCRTSLSAGRFSLSAAVGWCTQSVLNIHTGWKQSPQVGCGTQSGNSTRKEQQAMNGSPSVEAVSSVCCVSEPWRHKHPAVFLQAEGWPPQVQQGLSMTSVTSMPYTSSRSTRKERSPWGSSPMALTWSAVRVGSMLPATSDRVWKMRLFSSMKNLGQGHGQHCHNNG